MNLRRKTKPTVRNRERIRGAERSQPAAFSYYAQRSDHGTNTGREIGREEAATKPSVLQALLHRIGLFVLAVVILIVVISNLMLSSSPRIISVSTSSNQYFLHSLSDYQAAASVILKQSIWNGNKITINTAAVSQKVRQEFPELANVSVALPLVGHRPLIYVEPNQPALILNAASGSYVLDTNGLALLATTQLPTNAKLTLPIVTDQSGLKLSPGRQALTGDDVAFIRQIVQQLQARSIATTSLTLPPTASELDVYLAGQPYYAKFNMHASVKDARQQAGTFIAVQHKLASEAITPGKYIDVRVDGRAYYQ